MPAAGFRLDREAEWTKLLLVRIRGKCLDDHVRGIGTLLEYHMPPSSRDTFTEPDFGFL